MATLGMFGRGWRAVALAVLLLGPVAPAIEALPGAFPASAPAAAAKGANDGAGTEGKANAKRGKQDRKAGSRAKAGKRDGDRAKASRNAKAGRGKGQRPRKPPTATPTPTPPAGETCLQLAVPAYFDHQNSWDRMNADAPTTGMIVLNPESGPDKAFNATWLDRTKAAQAAGITVVGYVRTGLAKRDQSEVKADIDAYFDWYGVDGVFLDETSSDSEDLPYYREMAGHVHQVKPGAKVVTNPGWWPDERMMEFVDVVVTFEHDYARYAEREFPAWTKNYAAKRFMHVVFDVPNAAAAQETLALARERNAGYVYLTDVADPNLVFKSLGGGLWNEQVSGACG